MIVGYARVSTFGQSVDAQVKALRAAGAEIIFEEMASGPKIVRIQRRRALAHLAKGDVLMVTRLDRLARSMRDLLNTLDAIARAGAGFRSLGDKWADTTTPQAHLLPLLSGLAEFERQLVRMRTYEALGRAKAKGVRLGRKPKLTPRQKKDAIRRRDKGEETLREIAKHFNVSYSTISRLAL